MKYPKKQTDFLIYCIELYKSEKSVSGQMTIEFFKEKKIDEYILKNFETLHTFGDRYILEEIEMVSSWHK